MLYCAAAFSVIAIIAAVLGFGGIAAGAAGISKRSCHGGAYKLQRM